jgi:hypothetical protein
MNDTDKKLNLLSGLAATAPQGRIGGAVRRRRRARQSRARERRSREVALVQA